MMKDKIGVYKAIISRRSIRRFKQKKISLNLLNKFVNAARLAPSAANLQPLEYFVINEKDLCCKVFETLSWAGYIRPKWTPSENERPVAYIVILVKDPENKWYQRDASLAAENIILTAEENGIGCCILCNVNREKLKEYLKIPIGIIIDSLIVLGYKDEKSVIEEFKGSVEYWRDNKDVMHIPKRNFKDIIHINKF